MKKKIILLVLTCLMATALVLASCAPAVTEEEEEVVVAEEEEVAEEEVAEEEVAPVVEGPQYGGVANVCVISPVDFDPALTYARAHMLMYEALIAEDISKGPSGTGEIPLSTLYTPITGLAGQLAESWEQLDLTNFIFHLRQGIRWQNRPPVNGREFDADDVVFSFEWMTTDPRDRHFTGSATPEDQVYKAEAIDKYTVKLTAPRPDPTNLYWLANSMRVMPRELEGKDLLDWKNGIGSGPFMVTDFVPGSSTTLVRNPDYWQYDPFNPENRLPYIDSIVQLVIPDIATQLAAMRTGKMDHMLNITWLDGQSLMKTNPELKYRSLPTAANMLFMRTDLEPFNDLKVRKALHMAVDFEEIKRDYYDGQADMLTWPFMPDHLPAFRPIDELSESVQELFSYNPEKAKQLLAEAGYPDGFTTTCATSKPYVEEVSLLRDYFAAIGVDMEINVIESTAFTGVIYGHTYPGLVYFLWGNTKPESCFVYAYHVGHLYNFSIIEDSYIQDGFATIARTLDPDERTKMMRELGAYAIEQAHQIGFPAPYLFTFWSPWIKGYSGEYCIGAYYNAHGWLTYAWLDQGLKKEMGH